MELLDGSVVVVMSSMEVSTAFADLYTQDALVYSQRVV